MSASGFLPGLLTGVFLNACIDAVPRKEKITQYVIYCPSCSMRWKPGRGITTMGRFLLGGKCPRCGERRQRRYLLVLLLNALGWVWIVQSYGLNNRGLAGLFILSFSLVAACIDLENYLIPNGMVIFLLLAGILYFLVEPSFSLLNHTMGSLLGFTTLLLLAILSRGGVGGGDVKLAGAMGFWLGYPGILNALFWGALSGSIVGIILVIIGLKKQKDSVPFGPFLVLGFCLSFF